MVSEETYAAVVAENAQLRERVAQLEAKQAAREQRVAQLEVALAQALERVSELEAAKKGPPPFVKANVAERAPKPRKPRAPEHNRGRQCEVPTRLVKHRPQQCTRCGGRLSGWTLARRRQVVEIPPPAPVEVTEHQLYRGWCSYCHRWCAARVDLSGQVLGHGRLGVGVASLVAHLRIGLRLPLRAIQGYLADVHGLRVSLGELVDLLRRVAAAGQRTYEQLRAQVRTNAVVLADETGWREQGRNGYVWHAGTPAGVRYFEYHHSRAGAVINALLGDEFRGVLVSDFYAAYNDTPGGQHQRGFGSICCVTCTRSSSLAPTAPRCSPGRRRSRRSTSRLRPPRAGCVPPAGPRRCARPSTSGWSRPPRAWAPSSPRSPPPLRCTRPAPAAPPGRVVHLRAPRRRARRQQRGRARGAPGGRRPQDQRRQPQRAGPGSHTRMVLTSLFETWRAQGHHPLQACRRLLQGPLPQF